MEPCEWEQGTFEKDIFVSVDLVICEHTQKPWVVNFLQFLVILGPMKNSLFMKTVNLQEAINMVKQITAMGSTPWAALTPHPPAHIKMGITEWTDKMLMYILKHT